MSSQIPQGYVPPYIGLAGPLAFIGNIMGNNQSLSSMAGLYGLLDGGGVDATPVNVVPQAYNIAAGPILDQFHMNEAPWHGVHNIFTLTQDLNNNPENINAPQYQDIGSGAYQTASGPIDSLFGNLRGPMFGLHSVFGLTQQVNANNGYTGPTTVANTAYRDVAASNITQWGGFGQNISKVFTGIFDLLGRLG